MKLYTKKIAVNKNTSFGVEIQFTPSEIRTMADQAQMSYLEFITKMKETQEKLEEVGTELGEEA